MAEKMRVHILAKELNVSSKVIIEKCKAEGIDSVKNHMSALSAGLHATICEWFSEGQHGTALETAAPVDLQKVRIKRPRKKKAPAVEPEPETAAEPLEEHPEIAAPKEAAVAEALPAIAPAVDLETPPPPAVEAGSAAPAAQIEQTAALPTAAQALPLTADDVAAPSPLPATTSTPSPQPPPPVAPESTDEEKPRRKLIKKPVVPAGPQNVPTAARLKGPRVVRYEAPDYDVISPRSRQPKKDEGPEGDSLDQSPPQEIEREEARGPKGRGRFTVRRAAGRAAEAGEQLAEWRDRDLAERRERLAGATGRRIHRRSATSVAQPGGGATAVGPKTSATVHEPVRMKEFCAETGLNFVQLFKTLRDEFNILGNVNMTLDSETAQLLALHCGIELTIVPARTAIDEVREEYAQRERCHSAPRPPVVTLLGHVDHGKTSLMDRIRKTRVVAGEDGGITQHIGAYYIQTSHGPVTFLDTPGHEAFSAMRARGAQLTDVVVLVVAADDGIMPQTVEAIHHAQAAKVPIVVALNKIDLGEQNKMKIFGQLSEHGLTPSGDWGGQTDVIPTSAVSGAGVTELVEHLADLSSLMELKADPTLPARGTVIEAQTKAGVGAVAHVLVQEGTLRVGDFVVCGNAFGKSRSLLDDRGNRVEEATPGSPVELWGLDEVPAAGDALYAVENLQRAKLIATEIRRLRVEHGRVQTRRVRTLEDMVRQKSTDEVPELNVIIKADVDGSLAALQKALRELPSEEVRLTVRHAAVGAVNDSDILLAATANALILAFRVETSPGAKRLAEQHGVDVRSYRVIYEACDDIRKALSGMLAPEEKIENRGTAEVRQIFHIGKLGLVAGCYVQQGTVERNHLTRLVRDGVIVREGCKISSLRHVKDDVREVRAGMECGIRLDGFDDVHAGDRIETYEVIRIARTL